MSTAGATRRLTTACIGLGVALGVVLLATAAVWAAPAAAVSAALPSRTAAPRVARANIPHVARAYIIHGSHRTDRAENVKTLAALARATGVPARHVHVWPATFTARSAAARALLNACVAATHGAVRPGELGCTLSHMRAMAHALHTQPDLALPDVQEWVLLFEDDAALHADVPTSVAISRMHDALTRAARLDIDMVFFGWKFRDLVVAPQRRLAPFLWQTPLPLATHAYAVRGRALPLLLHLLHRRRCVAPIDVAFIQALKSCAVVTRSRIPRIIPLQLFRDALFTHVPSHSDTANEAAVDVGENEAT